MTKWEYFWEKIWPPIALTGIGALMFAGSSESERVLLLIAVAIFIGWKMGKKEGRD